MKNILLVEPAYRSKFPPLGLLRLSTYHKSRGDNVSFVRGLNASVRSVHWDRIYVSSLFTWELPRTVETIRYYSRSVSRPQDIFVGGVGVTLLPDYVRQNTQCTVIEGRLDNTGMLGPRSPAISDMLPDYQLLQSIDYPYYPADAYFVRITKGCIRKCSFCAVPRLEREFGYVSPLKTQISSTDKVHGPKQHLVVMDNNILAIDGIMGVLEDIAAHGFQAGARQNNRQRTVDFNQGIDARLIASNPDLAKGLAKICLSPVRLAFDFIGMRSSYESAVRIMANAGFVEFTNYMLFNFNDTPQELFDRLWINASLNTELGIRITGFPMRFIPMDDVSRRHISEKWRWRYLRGIQCVLLATRGLVSPNPNFIAGSFGDSYDRFLEILSMPDRYIVYRAHFGNEGVADWRRDFRRLSIGQKDAFLVLLDELNRKPRERAAMISRTKGRIRRLLEHYYPSGKVPPMTPPNKELSFQGVSVGYDAGPG